MEMGPADRRPSVDHHFRPLFKVVLGKRGVFDEFAVLHQLGVAHPPDALMGGRVEVSHPVGFHRRDHADRGNTGAAVLGHLTDKFSS